MRKISAREEVVFLFFSNWLMLFRGVARGGQGGQSPREFDRSVNPIWTMGADYARHTTASPPGFKMLSTPLLLIFKVQLFWERHKNLRNLPHGLDIYFVVQKEFKPWQDCANFCGLLKCWTLSEFLTWHISWLKVSIFYTPLFVSSSYYCKMLKSTSIAQLRKLSARLGLTQKHSARTCHY